MESLTYLNNDILLCVAAHLHSNHAHEESHLQSPKKTCTGLKNLSSTSQFFRALLVPLLFRNITIQGSWDTAYKGVEIVAQSKMMEDYARTLRISVSGDRNTPPPTGFVEKVVCILGRFEKVQTLDLYLPQDYMDHFDYAFRDAQLYLPNIQTVNVGPSCEFIIYACPAVESICTGSLIFLSHRDRLSGSLDANNLIDAAASAPHLTYFDMKGHWTQDQLEYVHKSLPYLEKLGVSGNLDYDMDFQVISKIISRFKKLKELILPDSATLNVGFRPPRCGNVYFGPNGAEVARQVRAQRQEAQARIARIVFHGHKGLKRLWIGDNTMCEFVHDHTGSGGSAGVVRWVHGRRES